MMYLMQGAAPIDYMGWPALTSSWVETETITLTAAQRTIGFGARRITIPCLGSDFMWGQSGADGFFTDFWDLLMDFNAAEGDTQQPEP